MAAVTLPVVTTYNDKGVKSAQTSLKSLVRGYAGAGVASGLLIKGVKDSITAASNLQETVSKNRVIFGKSAESVEAFAKTAASTFGQSEQQALDAAGTFAIFGKAAQLGGEDLVNFSTDFTVLASDMASFTNTSPEEAITAIGAALRGESEPIRKYGVLLNDATLKQRASTLGIYDGTGALTAQQKILATQAEILAQTSDAQGDFERTSDGLANKTRTLNAEFQNLSASAGKVLLPVATDLATVLGKTLTTATNASSGENGKFASTLIDMVTNVNGATRGLKDLARLLHLVANADETAVKSTRNLSRQFRSFENAMLRAYEDGLKPTKEELKKLETAQKAAEKTAKSHADTLRTRVSTAVKGVTQNLADAEKQLSDFANATRDSIKGFVSLSDAFKTQTDAEADVADALQARKEAYADLAKINPTEDAEQYADALQKVADAEKNVTAAQTTRAKSNYGQIFADQIAKAKKFAQNLQLLSSVGLTQDGLAQLINLGPIAGAQITDEMIAGTGSLTFNAFQQGLADIAAAGQSLGNVAAGSFFGGNVTAAQNALTQAKNYQITVNAGLVSNPAQVGRDIIEAIKSAERLSGQVFVSI
jgi:hypothetical protein